MKTAVITGSFSEIGLQVCRSLSLDGYQLICQFLSSTQGSILQSEGISFISTSVDFSDYKSIDKFIEFVNKNTKVVDVLVHCASKHEKNIINKNQELVFNSVSYVNLFSPIIITEKLVSKMKKSNNPSIIFISSTYAEKLGTLKNIYYASTKTSLHTVSRIFARELAPIRSNVIIPGYVDTQTYRLDRKTKQINRDKLSSLNKKLVPPSDIADVVSLLVKNKSINGSVIKVDGGLCI